MLKQNPSEKVQIPADITPEDLFGLTDDKRNKLIAAVLSTISKSQAAVKEIVIKQSTSKSKESKDNIEKGKKLFVELDQTKKKFEALIKNRW